MASRSTKAPTPSGAKDAKRFEAPAAAVETHHAIHIHAAMLGRLVRLISHIELLRTETAPAIQRSTATARGLAELDAILEGLTTETAVLKAVRRLLSNSGADRRSVRTHRRSDEPADH